MTVRVNALDRGGYSAFGGAYYNTIEHRVELSAFGANDVIDVVIEFSTTPSEVNYFERGISSSEPTISGNTVELQFQEMSACGIYDIDVIFSSGATQRVTFRANVGQVYYCCMATPDDTPTDDDDLDGGLVG